MTQSEDWRAGASMLLKKRGNTVTALQKQLVSYSGCKPEPVKYDVTLSGVEVLSTLNSSYALNLDYDRLRR